MRKKILILSILINFIFLFFFTMCVRYTDKNSYNIQNQKKKIEKKKIFLKNIQKLEVLIYFMELVFYLNYLKLRKI